MTEETDIVVVGNGLFGSAALRHLAERGHRVIGIGAAASGPDVRPGYDTQWPNHRVYSSHNDAARLTRRQDRNSSWAEVTEEAINRYRTLEQTSGISFFHDVGCLIASRPGGDGYSPDPTRVMQETGVDFSYFAPGDSAWRATWPEIAFPDTHYVAFEPAPAGYIQPKRLIEAQNVLAEGAGARLVADTVTGVERTDAGFAVRTASGSSVDAGRVLVAAGGFTNFNNLVTSPIDLTLKSEVIVLGEVSAADAEALARFPTVKYLNDPGDLEAIYMVPPVLYEDGRFYIKMGANTRLDQEFDDLDQVQRWFNTDTDPAYLPLYEPVLRALWPTIDFQSIHTQPCVITYSPDRFPIIDELDAGLFVATAGNGGGAKGSDVWGERAAILMTA